MQVIQDIRDKFAELYKNKEFVIDKNGGKTIELIGESFLCDEDFIFGEPNQDYIKKELEWYLSQSLNVNDIPGEVPKIWKRVSDVNGYINSNYGWMAFSEDNNNQYENALKELLRNQDSRRAVMIYQRPSMWHDYSFTGMSDFCCTWGTQHFIRNKELITHVVMRSNDSIFGLRNDKAWHQYVLDKLYNDLIDEDIELSSKKIIWTSGSLHIYDRHFYYIDHYIKTGEISIKKDDYNKLYNKL